MNTGIKHFVWGGKKVLDNDYKCLANSKIEVLDISPTQFTMLELAQLLALSSLNLRRSGLGYGKKTPFIVFLLIKYYNSNREFFHDGTEETYGKIYYGAGRGNYKQPLYFI